jgi:hypothetical protein
MHVEPSSLKTLIKLNLGKALTTPSYSRAFHSDVFGVDVNSGETVAFRMCASMVPFHVAGAIALASTVVKGVPVNDIYNEYTTKINKISEMMAVYEVDPEEYKEDFKYVLHSHSKKTTLKFLGRFMMLTDTEAKKRDTKRAKGSFETWTRSLFDSLDEKILTIENALKARVFEDSMENDLVGN